MAEIIFSEHAKDQLMERNIVARDVKVTIEKPDKLIIQLDQRLRAAKTIKMPNVKYLLVVIYERKHDTIEVVTAFKTSKFKKYL